VINFTSVIGISFFLHDNAKGHYFTVHSKYHDEFMRRGMSSFYLGNGNFESANDWIKSALFYDPLDLYRVRHIESLKSTYKNIAELTKSKNFIFVFESNFIYWLMIAISCSLNSNYAHVVLNRSDLIIESLRSNPNEFKKWFKFCTLVSGSRIEVSVLNEKLSKEILDITGIKVGVIPTFSGIDFSNCVLPKNKSISHDKKKVLVAAPYLSDLERLNEFLIEFPEIISEIRVTTWVQDVSLFFKHEVEVVNKHLPDNEYISLLMRSEHLVLLYTNIFHEYGSSSKVFDAASLGLNICTPINSAANEAARSVSNYCEFDSANNEDIKRAILAPVFINPKTKTRIPDVEVAVDFLLTKKASNFGQLIKDIISKLISRRIKKIILNGSEDQINGIKSNNIFRISNLL
jgi:hypothetical protein